ncbi:ArsR family transcriptional regulator [Clostridium sp. 19966]|uniref:ArsR/SmtB family transcription factor n=1 Tax=Clostridium sp. 19966 TaxID=2768166 RepID=UPI0028DDD235|nr:ArsR family transcriptional regulator [Clostridium sp. 19966]MDT8717694.1 ArsR family transcriptional regulator [Clostridium sp. 19966]
MRIDTSEKWLPVFEALASDVRLKIIQLLSVKSMNVKEIAQELELSSAIITMHINKLEKAGIVSSERTRSKGGVQKICSLSMDAIEVEFPNVKGEGRKFHEFIVPIGQYTDFQATPTCGLATTEKQIGYFDDPRYFLDPERVNAKILWFTQGYVEYKIPNYMLTSETPEELEISLEIGSEAPGYKETWPSDISFFINEVKLGEWTSPGDFGGEKGIYTPAWWSININQYGMLKVIRVTSSGTFIDGKKISDVTIHDIDINSKLWTFRIGVLEDAEHVGGLTIFGKGFGNYNQDIALKLFYK